MTGFSDNDIGSAAGWALAAGIVLWLAGRLGLPASVGIFVYVVAGFAALFAAAHLIDTVWFTFKRRGTKDEDEPEPGV